MTRALAQVWDRKVARLPDEGVLLVSTDLQGNLEDYHRMVALYRAEQDRGNRPILAFCGDLVHGPSPDLLGPGRWPSHLGKAYRDESVQVVREFDAFTRAHRGFSLMGNHEHAHVGGPVVPKFYPDEAAILDAELGDEREAAHAFFRSFPLLAVAPCGIVLTHGAPRATAPSIEAFEALSWSGYTHRSLWVMPEVDALGALLWSRGCTDAQALDLLEVVTGARAGVVAHGHDIVRDGVDASARHSLCFSTSFGLDDPRKVYLRLDLASRYRSTQDLRPGTEILPLVPER